MELESPLVLNRLNDEPFVRPGDFFLREKHSALEKEARKLGSLLRYARGVWRLCLDWTEVRRFGMTPLAARAGSSKQCLSGVGVRGMETTLVLAGRGLMPRRPT